MNKFSIAMLSIICTQQIHSMEKKAISTTDKDKYYDQYCEILRNTGSFTVEKYCENQICITFHSHSYGSYIPENINLLSLKLYNKNLNETDIKNLIDQGADINHNDHVYRECHGSLAAYHATNDSEQGIKNMDRLIKHGINLHNGRYHQIPLHIAAQDNKTDMIKLLLSPTLLPDEKVNTTKSTIQYLLDTVINYAFIFQNAEVIGSLLDLSLITPNRILKRLVTQINPNKDILNLLIQREADISDDLLFRMMHSAFPGLKNGGGTEYISCLKKMCESKENFSLDVYLHMLAIKKDIDTIVSSLEMNQQNNL
jgi:hypothetical protein